MKKRIKKVAPGYSDLRSYNTELYQNFDLEMRLIQNINKDKPQYSLD